MRREGDRLCRGWRASEVRTGGPGQRRVGELSLPRGTGHSGASRVGRGSVRPSARGLGGTAHRVRTEPLSAPCWRTAFLRRLLPAGSSWAGCCVGFLLPSAAHPRAPASRAPGLQPLLAAGTCPSGFRAQPGGVGVCPRSRLSAWVCSGRPRGPAASHTRARAPAPQPALLLADCLDVLGVGPGLPADPHPAAY